MQFERCLPSPMRADEYLEDAFDVFVNDTEAVKSDHEAGDLISSDVEFTSTYTLDYFTECSNQLVGYFIDDHSTGDTTFETHAAVYRALLFAYQTMEHIHEDETAFNVGAHLQHLINTCGEPPQAFAEEVHDYLAANPYVDAFISRFADDIDENRNQLPAIELAAGVGFMLIERRFGERFVGSEFGSIEPEDLIASVSPEEE
jgi:hypothetical protein